MSLVVSCFYWRDPSRDSRGYTFDHEYVRVLRNMVARNLTVPHRFVCVTDDKIDDIKTIPLDWSKHVPGTVYVRLMQHRPDYGQIIGADKVLNFDIDLVVTGNIDHVASRTEDIVLWRNPNFPQPGRAFYQSSVQLFTPGARPELWNDFDPVETPKWVNWRFGGAEQAWISERLSWDEAYFDHRDGIYGAGRLSGAGIYTELPQNACIVSVPGARAPWQAEVQEKHSWIREFYK